jgi:hypothetical protein
MPGGGGYRLVVAQTLVRFEARDFRDGEVSRSDKSRYDLLPAMLESRGWISDKVEGTAATADGRLYVITDNDGVDGWSGETSFLRLAPSAKLFKTRPTP